MRGIFGRLYLIICFFMDSRWWGTLSLENGQLLKSHWFRESTGDKIYRGYSTGDKVYAVA